MHQARQGQSGVTFSLKTHKRGNLSHRPIGVDHWGQMTHPGKRWGQIRRIADESKPGLCRNGTGPRAFLAGQHPVLNRHFGVDRENLPPHIGRTHAQCSFQGLIPVFALRQHDVIQLQARALIVQGLDQVGQGPPGPRPCALGMHTLFINVNDHQAALRRRLRLHIPSPVVAALVKRPESLWRHPSQHPHSAHGHAQTNGLEAPKMLGGPRHCSAKATVLRGHMDLRD